MNMSESNETLAAVARYLRIRTEHATQKALHESLKGHPLLPKGRKRKRKPYHVAPSEMPSVVANHSSTVNAPAIDDPVPRIVSSSINSTPSMPDRKSYCVDMQPNMTRHRRDAARSVRTCDHNLTREIEAKVFDTGPLTDGSFADIDHDDLLQLDYTASVLSGSTAVSLSALSANHAANASLEAVRLTHNASYADIRHDIDAHYFSDSSVERNDLTDIVFYSEVSQASRLRRVQDASGTSSEPVLVCKDDNDCSQTNTGAASPGIVTFADLEELITASTERFYPRVRRKPFPEILAQNLQPSPIHGISCTSCLRTCFSIGQALNTRSYASRTQSTVLVELFARLVINRDENDVATIYSLQDMSHDRPPHLPIDLTQSGSRHARYMLERIGGNLCRCIGAVYKDAGQNPSIAIMAAHAACWDDVEYAAASFRSNDDYARNADIAF